SEVGGLMEKWAECFKGLVWTGGARASQRVESEIGHATHHAVKKLGPKASLLDILEVVEDRVRKQESQAIKDAMRHQTTRTNLYQAAEAFFGADFPWKALKQTVSDYCYNSIRKEVNDLGFYVASRLEISALCDITLESLLVGTNGVFKALITNATQWEHKFTAKQLADLVRRENIVECWQTRCSSGKVEGLLVLKDGNVLCTCLKLYRHGFPCCHFFCILRSSRVACFAPKIINPRWLKDIVNGVDVISKIAPYRSNLVVNDELETSIAVPSTVVDYEVWDSIQQNSNSSLLERNRKVQRTALYAALMARFKEAAQFIVDSDSVSPNDTNLFMSRFDELFADLKEGLVGNGKSPDIQTPGGNESIANPAIATTKGRPLGSTNLKKNARKRGHDSIFHKMGSVESNGESTIAESTQKRKVGKENVDVNGKENEEKVANPIAARGRGRPPKRLKS
ncbi:hypothetical protein HDU76_010691, partial [Blyttiomyces sp. JEL0837]